MRTEIKDIDGQAHLVVAVPLVRGEPSSSGKTWKLASTGGFKGVGTWEGMPISVSLNVTAPRVVADAPVADLGKAKSLI